MNLDNGTPLRPVPKVFGTRDQFQGRPPRSRMVVMWDGWADDSSVLHLLCTLSLLLLHQLRLRSSGIRSHRLGTPALEGLVDGLNQLLYPDPLGQCLVHSDTVSNDLSGLNLAVSL